MPYEIRKFDSGFAVYNKATGKRKNKNPMSKVRCKRYMRALYHAEFGGTFTRTKKR